MKVLFKDEELEKCALDVEYGSRKLGSRRIKIYWKRLEFIKESSNFETLRILPGHFHELTGNRKGEWACDLDQPYRLVFKAGEDTDGKKWVEITSAEILEIVDYHK